MEKKQDSDRQQQKNPLEWTVFGISLLLVLAILSYLTYQAATARSNVSPDISVSHEPAPSPHNPYRYSITVHNHGDQTAETVLVEAVLIQGGQEREKAPLEIQFLPKHSKREGWVNFKTSSAAADSVVTRVVSYKRP